jgi:serine/threonine-protein kinase
VEPIFDEPPRSRGWLLGLAGVVIAAGLGAGLYFKDHRGPLVAPAVAALTPTPTPTPTSIPEPVALPVPTVDPAPVTATTGHLSVVTPIVVKVTEDKKELGTSPLELDLPPGPHTLRLVNKQLGIDQVAQITIAAGQTASLAELAKGTLVVKVEPWAYVKVDGKPLGQSPIPARSLYEGVHVVELNNNNLHETRRFEVKVKAGETRVVSVNLEE